MNHELCRLSWAHFICNRRIKIGDRKNKKEKNMQIVDSHITCIILLKFIFSKKAMKIDEIFTVNLTFTT